MNSFETKFGNHLRKLYRRKGAQMKLKKNNTTGTCSFDFGYLPVHVAFSPEVNIITLSTKVFQFHDDKLADANVDNIMDKACEVLKGQETATVVKRDFVLNCIVVESTAPLGMVEEDRYTQFCEYVSAHVGSYWNLRNVVIDLVAAEYKAVKQRENENLKIIENEKKGNKTKPRVGWFRRRSSNQSKPPAKRYSYTTENVNGSTDTELTY